MGNHAPCADHHVVANGNAGAEMASAADPNVASHRDGKGIFQKAIAELGIDGVACGIKTAIRADENKITKGDLPRIYEYAIIVCKEIIAHRNIASEAAEKIRLHVGAFSHLAEDLPQKSFSFFGALRAGEIIFSAKLGAF